MADSNSKFELLEQQLEMFIEDARQIGIIVADMTPTGQNVLNQKLLVSPQKQLCSILFVLKLQIIKKFSSLKKSVGHWTARY